MASLCDGPRSVSEHLFSFSSIVIITPNDTVIEDSISHARSEEQIMIETGYMDNWKLG